MARWPKVKFSAVRFNISRTTSILCNLARRLRQTALCSIQGCMRTGNYQQGAARNAKLFGAQRSRTASFSAGAESETECALGQVVARMGV